MTLSQVFFTLCLLTIITVTAGRPDIEHDNTHYLKIHTNTSNAAPRITTLDLQNDRGRSDPPFSLIEEVARGVSPPLIWDVLYDELPSSPFDTHEDYDTQSEWQPLPSDWVQMLAAYYLPNVSMVSPECKRDVNAITQGLISQKDWAQRVVDSWGKFSDGVLVLNTMVLGLFDECLMTTVHSQDPEAHFDGQYCSFSFGVKGSQMERMAEGDDDDDEERGEEQARMLPPHLRMANIKGILRMALPYNVMATCIPSTCTKEEYKDSLNHALDQRGLRLSMLSCQTKDLPTLRYNAADIIMIITLVVLGILVLVGTVTDVWINITKNEEMAKGPLRYFLVFSFYTNLAKIFHINVTENEEIISCLHGIRVLSMCWVVLGHSYLLSILYSANKGLAADIIALNPYMYQVVLNAFPSVDTFFLMTGILVAYNVMKEYQRTSKFNIIIYFVHRFLRLAPPILLLCGFFAVFPPLFVQGSMSPNMIEKNNIVDNCIKYWWRDSFFLTNVFVGQKDGQSCVPVCWYTAVEFQLYILTPLMFLPILYKRKPVVVYGVCVLTSVIVPMAVIGGYQLPPTVVMDASIEDAADTQKYVYTKPWCRASPYLVGIGLGYLLRVVPRDKMQLKWWQAVLGWIVALATMSAVVFGLKDYNTLDFSHPHEYVAAISILYGGLHRLAWGVAVAWMIFACHMGYGGPINTFLAHPIWQPLSRLTYTIFLIALNAQSIYYVYYSRLPIYFTAFYKAMETAGILMFSAFGAVLLSLLTESPVLGLEKLLLKRPKKSILPPSTDSTVTS